MKLQVRPQLSIGGLTALAFFPLAPMPLRPSNGAARHFGDPVPEDLAVQSRTKEDLRLAREIRNNMLNIRDLSMDGHHVEVVVTSDREVVLRGTAFSFDEVKKIVAVVKRCAAQHSIINNLRTLKN
ncbi:MAG: BON domain-containing protein [Candidatus Methylacidiphilales bacterium]|nr:BON domain-containing protein [Candidatus Methylacidiphilales bacterium]